MKELIKIQSELKAPKNQRNNFGKYNYRSCEDILEALKPLLKAYECTLILRDEVREVGGLVFIEAAAIIDNGDLSVTVKAQAGIDTNRKGMDVAQSYGSSSSYARKYALNGLFLIDDTKEIDSVEPSKTEPKKKKLAEGQIDLLINEGTLKELRDALAFAHLTAEEKEAITKRGKELKENGSK